MTIMFNDALFSIYRCRTVRSTPITHQDQGNRRNLISRVLPAPGKIFPQKTVGITPPKLPCTQGRGNLGRC